MLYVCRVNVLNIEYELIKNRRITDGNHLEIRKCIHERHHRKLS